MYSEYIYYMYKGKGGRGRGKRSSRPSLRKTMKMKPRVSKAVKTYVKKSISRNMENKSNDYISLNNAISASTAWNTSLLPLMSQGTAQNQRVGNEITVKYAYIKGHINLLPYNAVSNAFCCQRVKMWLVSQKQTNSTTIDLTYFFEYGNSSLGIQSNLGDTLYPVNKELFTVHGVRTFELGTTSQSSLTNSGAGQEYDNSKFTKPFYFSFGKYLKKVRYNDGSSTPTNRNIFLVVQSVNADGSSTVTPAEIHYFIHIGYEDA